MNETSLYLGAFNELGQVPSGDFQRVGEKCWDEVLIHEQVYLRAENETRWEDTK